MKHRCSRCVCSGWRRPVWLSLAGLFFVCALAWSPLRLLAPLLPVHATHCAGEAKGLSPPVAPPAAPASSSRQYAYVLAVSNHKTGTYQLHCIIRAFHNATGLPSVWQPDDATGEQLLAPLLRLLPRPPGRPQMIGAGHAVVQTCYGYRKQPRQGIFKCPNPQLPCGPSGAGALSLEGCMLSLPAMPMGAAGLVHFYRNPWDMVASAYWYHIQQPLPKYENWLEKPMGATADALMAAGVPRGELEALGVLTPAKRALTYVAVLRGLADTQAVQLQFWQLAPELYTMVRQYQIFKAVPGSVQIRFEDSQADLDAALQPLMREFYPQDGDRFLQAVKDNKCDPRLWTQQELASSDHVTGAKRAPGSKERLQRALWEQPAIRQHLCLLTASLGYDSPLPCSRGSGGAAAAQQGVPRARPLPVVA